MTPASLLIFALDQKTATPAMDKPSRAFGLPGVK